MSDFLLAVSTLCLAALYAGAAMCLYRVVIGPSAADRAVALDTLTMVFIGIICILCMTWRSDLYFDAVWVLTLVGYLGSVAIARYLEKGKIF
ncbi:MAG: monovalent cation/H+ antiporter complex subunit F [Steroidobacteraceae bacterium]